MHIKRIYHETKQNDIFGALNSRNVERDLRNVKCISVPRNDPILGADRLHRGSNTLQKQNKWWLVSYGWLQQLSFPWPQANSWLILPYSFLGSHTCSWMLAPVTDARAADSSEQFSRPLTQAGFSLKHRNLGRESNIEKERLPTPFSEFNSLEEKCHRCIKKKKAAMSDPFLD